MLDYKVDWLVEKRVIHIQIAGEYDLHTTQQGIQSIKKYVDVGVSPVHVIWDMSRVTTMPKDIREPIHELEILRYHPNGGWIVLVSSSVMVRFAGQIATRFLGANFRSVVSYDEAVETICRIDESLAHALKHALPASL